ncbi:hypothetical protein D3C71_1095980 [compost metagenome]
MGSGFGDLAVFQHHQPVHPGDGREPVSDGDHGFALHQGLEAFLDRRFDFRVQCRRGLIHDQDRRVLEQYPGDGNALALAAGEFHPALTDVGIETGTAFSVRQRRNETVSPGLVHRFPELGVGGVGFAIQQVVTDRAVQQRGVLGDHADAFAQAFLADVGDVLAVDQDASAFDVVQAQQQVHQG